MNPLRSCIQSNNPPFKVFFGGGGERNVLFVLGCWVGLNKTSWLGSESSHYPEHLLIWLICRVINSVGELAKTGEWRQKHIFMSLGRVYSWENCVRCESRCVLLSYPENWNSENLNFACLVTREGRGWHIAVDCSPLPRRESPPARYATLQLGVSSELSALC